MTMPPQQPPGYYPDPSTPGQDRWWNGTDWTDQTRASAVTGVPGGGGQAGSDQDQRQWAMIGHLSALAGLIIGGLTFVGPLIVYLVKKDDGPFVRDQSAEALNFNLSFILYWIGLLIVSAILGIVIGIVTFGIGFFGVFIVFAIVGLVASIGWLVLLILAAMKSNSGEAYRYPLTIRFVT